MGLSFVSLDCDFFNPLNHSSLRPYLDQLVALCRGRHFIPIRAVTNHQQMLPLLNASGATKLVNMDTHSDLADEPMELNCGTWVSFFKGRRDSHYHWIHADGIWAGECNGDDPIFRRRGVNHDMTDWGLVTHQKVRRAPNLETLLCDACMVCVCSSPSYACSELQAQFHAWRKEHGIHYTKGRKNERYGRKATPSRRSSLTAGARSVESLLHRDHHIIRTAG